MSKRLMSITLILVLMLSSIFTFAEDTTEGVDEGLWLNTDETEAIFIDVNEEDWYYEAVMTMNRYGIISGYGDGTFRPLTLVNREEFAVMMVQALKLELKETTSSFTDVADDYWASKYIEAAKKYITGYKSNDEYYYKPKQDAEREDMAVALVRALNKSTGGVSLEALNPYADKDQVSKNLYEFVASAIYNNLMSCYEEDGVKLFKPTASLTRAEVAALLLSVVKEEKIVFDIEEKVVMNDGDFLLELSTVEGGLKLDWNFETDKEVSGYKVVASKLNENPMYPGDGYAKYIQTSSTIIYNGDSYNSGDFQTFEPGAEYYFAITALVGDEKISSNVIKASMPTAVSTEGRVPVVKVSQLGDGILVEWEEINGIGLQGYKVVASKYDKTPVYPENGYAKWITNLSTRSYYIEPYSNYSGGDVGGSFKPGETYHISVTAVYSSGKVAGNTVTYIMPGEPEAEVSISERTPQVEVTVNAGYLVVEWSEISTRGLSGYKIVASKSNPNPVYSQDGYAFWITDLSTHRKEIYVGANYNGGDLGGNFVAGEQYYVSVTAVYSDAKIAGNAALVIMPD